jgi:DNA-directed RNA polymerase alpha subunit
LRRKSLEEIPVEPSERSAKITPPASPGDLPPGLSRPAQRALAAAEITRLEQLAQISEAELLKLHGIGPKAIRTLKDAMAQRGLAFAGPDSSRRIIEQANQHIERRAL